jgi:hypothetical protein
MVASSPLLCLFMVLAPACGHGTQPPLPSLGEPARDRLDLLAGRLSFLPPDSAVVAPAAHGLMSAPASTDEEMRIVLVPGEERSRFVMMVRELFATLEPEPAAARAQIAAWVGGDMVSAEVTLGDGSVAIEYVPRRVADVPAGTSSSPPPLVMIYGAIVEASDHTAISVEFYVSGDDVSARDEWAMRARALVGTIQRGTRRLDLPARVATLGTLAVDLPPATALTQQQGPDFTVYHLYKLVKLGSSSSVELGIYVGGWPTFKYQQAQVPVSRIATEAGTLLGQEVLWHTWAENDGAVREAIVTVGDHDRVHVWSVLFGDDPEVATWVRDVVASLRASGQLDGRGADQGEGG